jgi:hypothetical protein
LAIEGAFFSSADAPLPLTPHQPISKNYCRQYIGNDAAKYKHTYKCTMYNTLIKNKIKFSLYIRKFRGIGCNVIYDYNDLLINGINICAFPHILGSSSSYLTLHPIPSEFPYI